MAPSAATPSPVFGSGPATKNDNNLDKTTTPRQLRQRRLKPQRFDDCNPPNADPNFDDSDAPKGLGYEIVVMARWRDCALRILILS